jgi:acetyl-CoA carboxylase biotin carboxyl carrier protein
VNAWYRWRWLAIKDLFPVGAIRQFAIFKGAEVADEASNIPSPFDVRTIKYLVRLMSTHDLSEIDLREGDLRIRLRRGAGDMTGAPSVAVTPSLSVPTAPLAAQPIQAVSATAEQNAKHLSTIKSPTPGTFYSSPSPDADAFVKVGSRVAPSTVVCVIEAMKIFNEITADCAGVITEICVENQQAVEYNQVLFKVDPAA